VPQQADLLAQLRHHRGAIADLSRRLFERPGDVTMRRARVGLERVEREGGAALHFAPTYALIEEAGWELAGWQFAHARPRRRRRRFAARDPQRGRQGWRRPPRRRR